MNIGCGNHRQNQYNIRAKKGADAYSIHHGAFKRNMGWSSAIGNQKNPKSKNAPMRDSVVSRIALSFKAYYIQYIWI